MILLPVEFFPTILFSFWFLLERIFSNDDLAVNKQEFSKNLFSSLKINKVIQEDALLIDFI